MKKLSVFITFVSSVFFATVASYQVFTVSKKPDCVPPPPVEAKVQSTKNQLPYATGPLYLLKFYNNHANWSNRVSSEEINFRVDLAATEHLFVDATELYAIEFYDETGTELLTFEQESRNQFSSKYEMVAPHAGAYYVKLYYRLGSGADEKATDFIYTNIVFERS